MDGDNCNCELLINEYEATEREKRRKNRRCGLGETLDAKRESATAGGEKVGFRQIISSGISSKKAAWTPYSQRE